MMTVSSGATRTRRALHHHLQKAMFETHRCCVRQQQLQDGSYTNRTVLHVMMMECGSWSWDGVGNGVGSLTPWLGSLCGSNSIMYRKAPKTQR